MTDFASEFARVFGNGCDVKNTDWNGKRYFDSLNNPDYEAEHALAQSLTSEAYMQSGFSVQYFIKKNSVDRDKLYGEDALENFERRFKLQVYADSVPALQKMYQLQGMIYTEIVTVQATIMHFEEASTVDFVTGEASWPAAVPAIGDVMYFPWCDLYYEVLNVKEFAEGTAFLSKPITYTFSLRVWRNSHEDVDIAQANDDKMEHLRSYVELSEVFDMNHKTSPTEHENESLGIAEDIPLPTSKVKADGDVLAINRKLENDTNSQVLWEDRTKGKPSVDPWAGW